MERQVSELYAMGAQFVVQEYDSGSNKFREGLSELVKALAYGDTLIATEVSRVTRSLLHLCEVIELAKEKCLLLKFGPLDFDFSCISPFSLAMLQIMGVFAELERNVAAERIISGLAQAKAKGVKLGRPRITAADVPVKLRALYPDFLAGKITMAGLARMAGVSRPSAYKYVRLLGDEG